MSQPMEPKGDETVPFSWGVKMETINFYESFTLKDVEYSLYDTVCLQRDDQIDIGKLIKIMEMEKQEKKVEVVWFFRPTDIVTCLGDAKPLEREIFLACGEGKGLSNINPLEAIIGKCNIVCSSKDQRNPQPTEEELGLADFIFYRTFDVGRRKVSEEFPSSIAGIEVDHFFNRRSSETSGVDSEPEAHLRARSEKGLDINSSIRDRPHAGGNIKRSEHFLSPSPSDISPMKKKKLLSSSALGEEKRVKFSCSKNTDLSTRKSLHSETSGFTGKGPVNKQHVGTGISYKFSEVTRKPVMDSTKWLKLEVWAEERLNEVNEKGRLLVLENFDPSFAASEVEDIVWHVFRENVKAKMVQCTAYSSPHSGQALVMFKTKEAAENAISQLINNCLVLGDGRPIVFRRKFLRKVGVADRFVGHLSIDRSRSYRQREEIRNAVSTSHFSQGNTVEFEMAIQWRALQEKSHRWWTALREQQGKEIEALMKQMKIHSPE
ncbi:protein ANTI-SILENCING 1-like isoform X2 [Salvia miltiorrhiza]|uniref:protein ANTI-SILENCING 1-like isoform X2 n=1 Tax=Salvia miltiorrhiza TaxID=226208 RepID=UPI0025AD0640|nr:protein ANTI-SILENCING 1-like isoform X2 [Salvia miltiorrhiza]